MHVAPRRAGRPSVRDLQDPSAPVGRWGQGVGADTPPRSAPGARQGAPPRRPTPRGAPGRLPRAGALPRAEDPGRASSRQACELPPSGAQGEPSLAAATETAVALPLSPHPAPCPEVLPGWGPSGAIARPRRRRGHTPASGLSRSRQPVAAGASRTWNAETPLRPRSRVRGSPGQPARRPQIEPLWRRSEAELYRGRAGYIVSSPRLPPAPLPPPFFPPRPGPRGHPPASVWPSLLPLLSHPDLFVPHHPGTPAPLPSPLAAWTAPQAADAARSEVDRTAVPRER